MSLRKIIEAYYLSEQFVNLMDRFEQEGRMYGELVQSPDGKEYFACDALREQMMQEHRASMVLGSLAYTIMHLKSMSAAQRFYHHKFGKPCPIKYN